MQVLRKQDFAVWRANRFVLFVVPALALLLNACAVQKAYRFTAKSVTKITYDPNHCIELSNGTYKCKDVVFTVSSIEPGTK